MTYTNKLRKRKKYKFIWHWKIKECHLLYAHEGWLFCLQIMSSLMHFLDASHFSPKSWIIFWKVLNGTQFDCVSHILFFPSLGDPLYFPKPWTFLWLAGCRALNPPNGLILFPILIIVGSVICIVFCLIGQIFDLCILNQIQWSNTSYLQWKKYGAKI